ncbi:unnamed protein product [Durusdinium trenchii]|uniref:Uncharacterized protein n=1 Tax=Durusdinium trenchii TaxID=1381693 RepID=A0ABP0LZ57_9DINO
MAIRHIGDGNVCRCICGDFPQENTTILVPSSTGCQDCNTALCLHQFRGCVIAQKHGGAVAVHCIHRTALMPRLAVGLLIVVALVLVIAALNKDRWAIARRIYDGIGEKDA